MPSEFASLKYKRVLAKYYEFYEDKSVISTQKSLADEIEKWGDKNKKKTKTKPVYNESFDKFGHFIPNIDDKLNEFRNDHELNDSFLQGILFSLFKHS